MREYTVYTGTMPIFEFRSFWHRQILCSSWSGDKHDGAGLPRRGRRARDRIFNVQDHLEQPSSMASPPDQPVRSIYQICWDIVVVDVL
jgi:hypothetical protein